MIIDGIDKIDSLPAPVLGLLPAVHDATVTDYTLAFGTTLPAVEPGQVLLNNTGAAVTLPGFGSWPPQKLPMGSYAGCDGRFWFPVRRYKETNSYYPQAWERTLYTLAFTSQSLPAGSTFTLRRLLAVRLLSNNTDAVWNWVWEIGMRVAQTNPSPIGPNLEGYVWRRPLIDQQMHVTDVVSRHDMGVQLRRTLSGADEVWSGNISRYEKSLAAQSDQLPTGNDFVLRVRLSCFDTQNDVPNPRGFAAYFCTAPEAR
jgi:hypothetical protein